MESFVMKKYVVATILLIAVLAGSFKIVMYMDEKSFIERRPGGGYKFAERDDYGCY